MIPNLNPDPINIVVWLQQWFIKKINIITSFSNVLSDTNVPSEKLVKNSLDEKVDKVNGKGLSTNDYTNIDKAKVNNLQNVAFSGSYDDLTNKPEISGSGEIVNIGFGFDTNTKEIYLEFNGE